jgi:hypothetical protein
MLNIYYAGCPSGSEVREIRGLFSLFTVRQFQPEPNIFVSGHGHKSRRSIHSKRQFTPVLSMVMVINQDCPHQARCIRQTFGVEVQIPRLPVVFVEFSVYKFGLPLHHKWNNTHKYTDSYLF